MESVLVCKSKYKSIGHVTCNSKLITFTNVRRIVIYICLPTYPPVHYIIQASNSARETRRGYVTILNVWKFIQCGALITN